MHIIKTLQNTWGRVARIRKRLGQVFVSFWLSCARPCNSDPAGGAVKTAGEGLE